MALILVYISIIGKLDINAAVRPSRITLPIHVSNHAAADQRTHGCVEKVGSLYLYRRSLYAFGSRSTLSAREKRQY